MNRKLFSSLGTFLFPPVTHSSLLSFEVGLFPTSILITAIWPSPSFSIFSPVPSSLIPTGGV